MRASEAGLSASRWDMFRSRLPKGGSLPTHVFERRHRAILIVTALHVPVVVVFAAVQGHSTLESMAGGAVIAAFAGVGAIRRLDRRVRASAAVLGLLTASAVLVHLSNGLIEMHFHFFVVIGLFSLYEAWQPYVLALAYIFLQHGVMGMLDPASVYNHPAGQAHPWLWALIHGGFVLAVSAMYLISWRLNEDYRAAVSDSFLRLQDSEERYRGLVETMADVVFELNRAGEWTYLGPVWTELTGYTVEECLGRSSLDFVHPVDPDFDPHVTRDVECRLVTASGEERTVQARWRTVPGADGEIVSITGTLRDVSDRRRLELELSQAQRLESVGRLAAGIAHEINTPIQYIGDNVEFLDKACHSLLGLLVRYRSELDDDRLADTAEVRRARLAEAEERADLAFLEQEMPDAVAGALEGVERVASIVQAMKSFGYDQSTEMSPINVNELLAKTLTVARGDIERVADVQTRLANVPRVHGSAADLGQVFLSLILNAADAIAERWQGEKGQIRIRTRREPDAVIVDVADNGSGIPPDIQPRIFDQFFSTKEPGQGAGQGLAHARAVVVNKHRGRLSFETEPGKGTTFTVRLPVATPERATS